MNLPKAPDVTGRKKMAISFVESSCYEGIDFDRTMIALIKNGHVIFEHPDKFRITQEGYDFIQEEKQIKELELLFNDEEDKH